jgi:hypothetical protein
LWEFSGLVITYKPGVIQLKHDLVQYGLTRGDTILTYTYRGEGFSAVWFKGRYYREFDISFSKWPDGMGCGRTDCEGTYLDLGEKVWWAKVKLKAGTVGWVNMNKAQFSGVDLLASINNDDRSLSRVETMRTASVDRHRPNRNRTYGNTTRNALKGYQ